MSHIAQPDSSPDLSCLICSGNLQPLAEDHSLFGSNKRGDDVRPFRLFSCRRCGHVQKALDEHWLASVQNLYERDYHFIGRHINVVNGTVISRDRMAADLFIRLLNLGETGAMLDVGCGHGTFLHEFAQARPGWISAGHELNDLHKERILSEGATRFYAGSLDAIEERFDVITLNHVVEHLPDPVSVLKSAARLLKPGGAMIIRVPCFQRVKTDLFFMEHCSHYTQQTLATVVGVSGMKVVHQIEGLAEIEIGVIAVAAEEAQPLICDTQARLDAFDSLAWAESLPVFIRENTNGRPFGIFGMGGAGLWLGVLFKGQLSFIVDEDPSKQGGNFIGTPIISVAQVPAGAVVFVTFNNPAASELLCQRLSRRHTGIQFLAIPAVAKEPQKFVA